MNSNKVHLSFCGGSGSVTGANFLLETPSKKILIDCGLEQGTPVAEQFNRDPFPYDPSEIDFLLVTHAHADHIGRIPKLVKDGFKGMIYSTPATLELARVMLPDSLHLIETHARQQGVLPLYNEQDMNKALALWKSVPYHAKVELGADVTVFLKDSGHILGSAMFEVSVAREGGKTLKVVFTGDLGNSPSLFLRDTDPITDADYMVMESVYGDRNHESKEERAKAFHDIIVDTINRKRTLIIPAFALERTQDILYEINNLIESNIVPPIPVFVDSPLATKVTEIYTKYTDEFNDTAKDLLAQGDNLFDFPKLQFAIHKEQSDKIWHTANPKIVIAGSGMSNGGRVVKHEHHYLPDPHATILFVGYQVAGTLGRLILDGAKEITIEGEKVPVRAEVKRIMGYSSHKDSEHLVEFVADTALSVKKVFVAMGEPKAGLFLVQRLRDYLNVNAVFPKKGDRVELE